MGRRRRCTPSKWARPPCPTPSPKPSPTPQQLDPPASITRRFLSTPVWQPTHGSRCPVEPTPTPTTHPTRSSTPSVDNLCFAPSFQFVLPGKRPRPELLGPSSSTPVRTDPIQSKSLWAIRPSSCPTARQPSHWAWATRHNPVISHSVPKHTQGTIQRPATHPSRVLYDQYGCTRGGHKFAPNGGLPALLSGACSGAGYGRPTTPFYASTATSHVITKLSSLQEAALKEKRTKILAFDAFFEFFKEVHTDVKVYFLSKSKLLKKFVNFEFWCQKR